MNHELPDVQAGFRKGRGTRVQIANICWIIKKQESFRKTSISALLTMPKSFTVWITTNCGKFLKRWEYWSGVPFPSPGYLPSPGIEPGSRALQADTLPSEPPREFQKNIYFCFIDYAKVFYCVDHNKLWEILKDMGLPAHLTCLLRNLYAGQKES